MGVDGRKVEVVGESKRRLEENREKKEKVEVSRRIRINGKYGVKSSRYGIGGEKNK